MVLDCIKDNLNNKTRMCRCGDHKCLHQMALKLPLAMQKEFTCAQEADLYRTSVYRRDYCDQPDILDRFPLELPKPCDNLKMNSTFGYPSKVSMSKDDFIPWSLKDQAMCRSKLLVPHNILKDPSKVEYGDIPTCLPKNFHEYSYYCPPHCSGNEKPVKEGNCLLGHKKQFNLGPPTIEAFTLPEKLKQPFAKYTNYMLDYKGSKIPPKRKLFKQYPGIRGQCHISSKTTYRDAFGLPSEMTHKPQKMTGQVDNLSTGDGPMVQQSISMLDYKDPHVHTHIPVRAPHQIYHSPHCPMETTTTTGRDYTWKDLPLQPKIQTDEDISYGHPETDARRYITTYQEDFDGLFCSASL